MVWRWDQQEPFGNNVADENPSGFGVFDLPLRLPGQYFDKETNLHYNYYRDYDPSLGRYGESDPIGLIGGLNTYAYVRGAPLTGIDPTGLVDWTGTFAGGNVGRGMAAGLFRFDLVSECVNGKQGHAKGWAIGVGFGLGVDASYTASASTFKDYETEPNPDVFAGNFLYAQAGVALCSRTLHRCTGVAYTGILLLGDAYAPAGLGSQVGFDLGANVVGGRSFVTTHQVTPCCKK